MHSFWIGFFIGIAAGQLVLFVLVRHNVADAIKHWKRRPWRRVETLFWRAFETLLNYLDTLLATKRARDATDLGSPNLIE